MLLPPIKIVLILFTFFLELVALETVLCHLLLAHFLASVPIPDVVILISVFVNAQPLFLVLYKFSIIDILFWLPL